MNISPSKKAVELYSGKMAESVKVIVRCRPLNERELSLKCECVVEMSEERGQCSIRKPDQADQPPKQFTFDGAYFTQSTTEQIYNDIAYPLVEGVVEGYNGTVFAYGQTGCGKSFSMQGVENPPSQRGIIPRAFQHIFESVEVAENTKYLVHASYLEIYNEDIRDLLSTNIKQKLELKEHPDRGVYVRDLSMHPVSNVEECEKIMSAGWKNRSVGATLMNADSSRSHSIFTIYLEACDTGIDGGDHIRAGKLNLVDLAGSERQSKTGATGERLREATKINLSLSALGNVISALVDGKSKHIPYRDSKLTRLLQDSLGGNTKTLMVACLSPADNNYEETISTLRYANRAKNIKNKPRINEDPKDALLREYQEEIKKLRGLLAGQLGPEGIKALNLDSDDDKKFSVCTKEALLEGQSPPPRPKSVMRDEQTKESTGQSDETESIRKEFEKKLMELKGKYEAEQMSNAKLQEDMNKLQSQYDEQLAQMIKMSDSNLEQSPNTESNSSQLARKPQVATYIGSVDNSSLGEVRSGDDGEIMEQQKEALKRLQMLQQNMVGGEKANDEAAKEKRHKRKKHVDERKLLLAKAAKEDDEVIMLNVYDSIHDEIKARDKIIAKREHQLEAAKMEIEDVSYEFERDRTEYLSTIRKQEKEISFLQALISKIHPTLRRDCNYSNLDRVRSESSWNEDQYIWTLPDLFITKTTLPNPTGSQSKTGMRSSLPAQHSNGVESYPLSERDTISGEDRYLSKLNSSNNEEIANNYFMPKRHVHHIISYAHKDSVSKGFQGLGSHSSSTPILSNGLANGDRISPIQYNGHPSTSAIQSPSSNGMAMNMDLSLVRRPHRLDSLTPVTTNSKSRKKKKKHSDLQ